MIWLGAVLGALFVGPVIASAQEIVVLSGDAPSAGASLDGGAMREYWVDYKAGQPVSANVTWAGNPSMWSGLLGPATDTAGPATGLGFEVWSPDGSEVDTQTLGQSRKGFPLSCRETANTPCWAWSQPSISLQEAISGRYLANVYNYTSVGDSYSIAVSGL